MAETEMLTVFVYDVASDRARRRLSAFFEDFAVRVQKSVFEARLTAARTRTLARQASAFLGKGDSLRVYAVAADGRSRCLTYGGTPLLEDEPFYLL